MKLIPPVYPTHAEIMDIMAVPDWLERYHLPETKSEGELQTIVATNDEVVAAAQLKFPEDEGCCLCWLVGKTGDVLRILVESVIELARSRGYRKLWPYRNLFSVGWSGIPDTWSHLVDCLVTQGFHVGLVAHGNPMSASKGYPCCTTHGLQVKMAHGFG